MRTADEIQRSARETGQAIASANASSNREVQEQGFETRQAIAESTRQQVAAQADTRQAVVGAVTKLGMHVALGDGLSRHGCDFTGRIAVLEHTAYRHSRARASRPDSHESRRRLAA